MIFIYCLLHYNTVHNRARWMHTFNALNWSSDNVFEAFSYVRWSYLCKFQSHLCYKYSDYVSFKISS